MSLVYFDVSIGGSPTGRMVFRLFDSIVPRTAMNFKCLCTGERGTGSTTGKNLSYENTIFHRVIAGFMCQGGDFSKRDGTGGESIYGGKFADESFRVKHTKYGQLSMANAGPNTNGSQFFITFGSTPHLDGKHVVFGEIVEGVNVLNKIEKVDTGDRDRPVFGQEVQITACGVIGERKEEAKTSSKRNLDEIHEALNSEQTTDKRHKKERKDKKEKNEKKDKKSKKHKKKSGKSSKKSKKRRYSSSSSDSSTESDSDRNDDSSMSSKDSVAKHTSKNASETESKHADVAKHAERMLDAEEGEVLDTSAIIENEAAEEEKEFRGQGDDAREPKPAPPARVDADGVVCKGRGMIKYRDGPANGSRRTVGSGDGRGDRDSERGGNKWDRPRDQRGAGGNNRDQGRDGVRASDRAPRERYVPKERSYDRDRSRSHSRSRSRSRSAVRAQSDSFRGEGEREQVERSEKAQKVDKVDKEQLSVAERMQRPLGGSR